MLTISPEIEQLAERLSKITGDSPDAAVAKALHEKLDRLGSNPRAGLADRLMEIGRRSAPLWQEPYKSMDHGDLLYDENGLPK